MRQSPPVRRLIERKLIGARNRRAPAVRDSQTGYSRRGGASIIELMVVVAIIATLIGLIIPAVQRIRDAAARTRCGNNLRQLGLALHQYHDTYHRFPPGVTNDSSGDRCPYVSWNARLLPFLEQASAWGDIERAFATDRNFLNVPPHALGTKPVLVFSCPSDTRVAEPSRFGPAFTSYLGVEGTDQFSQDGMLFVNSKTKFADISDGTSNTLMAGERPGSADEKLGWWYAGWGQSQDGSAEMVLGVREYAVPAYGSGCPRGPYHFQSGRFNNQCDTFHFWSPHFGGASFLFADGSVHFLRYGADAVMPALATRAGSEPFDWP